MRKRIQPRIPERKVNRKAAIQPRKKRTVGFGENFASHLKAKFTA